MRDFLLGSKLVLALPPLSDSPPSLASPCEDSSTFILVPVKMNALRFEALMISTMSKTILVTIKVVL